MRWMNKRVLVVSDGPDVQAFLRAALQTAGYEVIVCANGPEGLAIAKHDLPDVIILDQILPERNGIAVCRDLRNHPSTLKIPILMLANKEGKVYLEDAFEAGVDDFVTKPLSMRELVLRVRAVARRVSDRELAKPIPVRAGLLSLDRADMTATIGCKILRLTPTEFRLLETMVRQVGTIQSRKTLLSRVWGYRESLDTRTVDTHMRRLRKKLGRTGSLLETVWGIGYRLSNDQL